MHYQLNKIIKNNKFFIRKVVLLCDFFKNNDCNDCYKQGKNKKNHQEKKLIKIISVLDDKEGSDFRDENF